MCLESSIVRCFLCGCLASNGWAYLECTCMSIWVYEPQSANGLHYLQTTVHTAGRPGQCRTRCSQGPRPCWYSEEVHKGQPLYTLADSLRHIFYLLNVSLNPLNSTISGQLVGEGINFRYCSKQITVLNSCVPLKYAFFHALQKRISS